MRDTITILQEGFKGNLTTLRELQVSRVFPTRTPPRLHGVIGDLQALGRRPKFDRLPVQAKTLCFPSLASI